MKLSYILPLHSKSPALYSTEYPLVACVLGSSDAPHHSSIHRNTSSDHLIEFKGLSTNCRRWNESAVGSKSVAHRAVACTHVVLGREDQETARDIEALQGVEDAERLAFDESVVLASVCGGKKASAPGL